MFLYLERRRGEEKEGEQQREENQALNGPMVSLLHVKTSHYN